MKKILLLLTCVIGMLVANAQTDNKPVKIYNVEANAKADLDKAIAKAKKENKNVFVQVGGNWCVWCIRFHDLVDATPELKNYLNEKYETVLVNYSPENKNEETLKRLKNPGRFGFPVFVILNGAGEVIHIQNSAYLEKGNGHDPKLILDFLKNWTVAAVNSK
ncbi:thioredoxin family protein [Pedobacter montanisoli]|uniref:Thioredoxin family protein n=1 Tax=Pedobacter montanisoli TaxID=2923277 RepID=A0ABS9ZUK1_9SPHI|nr:thioredoxin family protein [Pedobacter montanisoli]MCJ0741988.1 thioredoxin family protein [Pedobacter montanisoli]